jgi:hypothetical protein
MEGREAIGENLELEARIDEITKISGGTWACTHCGKTNDDRYSVTLR